MHERLTPGASLRRLPPAGPPPLHDPPRGPDPRTGHLAAPEGAGRAGRARVARGRSRPAPRSSPPT
eukprot:20589-Pyramimonas_sp.AAC.1